MKQTFAAVGTSAVAAALRRRGISDTFMAEVFPLRAGQPRMVGVAFTIRYVPSRADLQARSAAAMQLTLRAIEECPEGHVLVVDARGDAGAASAGDLFALRLQMRGCAGIVTDGGLRDCEGIASTGLPAFLRRPCPTPTAYMHYPVDLQVAVACGGVAVFPGDVIVGDSDGVIVVPADIAEAVATEAEAIARFDAFAEERVRAGRPLPGLFPVPDQDTKSEFENWRLSTVPKS